MDVTVPSTERYRRADKVAASHTQVNDLFFPSEYYAQVFHSDARRVCTAVNARKVLELRADLTMDILRAVGDGEKQAIEKAAEAARVMNMAMEMRAAMTVSSLLSEGQKAHAVAEQSRRELQLVQTKLRELEASEGERRSQLQAQHEKLKHKLSSETANVERATRRITELEGHLRQQRDDLKEVEASAQERIASTMVEAEEALEDEHRSRVQSATEWANREQQAKQLATKRLFEVDGERREMVQLMVAEREARRVVEQKLQRMRGDSEVSGDKVEELERHKLRRDKEFIELSKQLAESREVQSALQRTIVTNEEKRNQLDDDLRVERKWRERLDSELAEAMRLGDGGEEDNAGKRDMLQRLIERHAEGERASSKRANEAERKLAEATHEKAAVDQELKIQQQAWEEVMEEHVRLQMTISQLRAELDAAQTPEGARQMVAQKLALEKKVVALEARLRATDGGLKVRVPTPSQRGIPNTSSYGGEVEAAISEINDEIMTLRLPRIPSAGSSRGYT
eukprot:TRINITY_DN7400_c0_g1_i7.p1 TRINITY_DN7400_c0_g1~~TRINITY_DN7400_c0_g1_i7.p1  ORF type:complete len:513 (+),score=178.52 TRINITY_DN7400_c0_g1_i7:133-1671(+)